MKRVFIDSDVILDALLKRPLFELAAKNILLNSNRDKLYTSSSTVSIINVDEYVIDAALNSHFADFEDAVQYFAAKEAEIDIIITRNTKDSKQAIIPVLTPEQFLKTL